ncbi:unnamed protein product, partial [Timema podura]|nr:unnamed protein product [Timema podura]
MKVEMYMDISQQIWAGYAQNWGRSGANLVFPDLANSSFGPDLMWEFLGSLIITTALSALLSLVFESPIISIEKALLEKGNK